MKFPTDVTQSCAKTPGHDLTYNEKPYWDNINWRLKLLIPSKVADNNNLDNEIFAIINEFKYI